MVWNLDREFIEIGHPTFDEISQTINVLLKQTIILNICNTHCIIIFVDEHIWCVQCKQ